MTKHEIETELKELNNRLDKAEIYFKTLDHCEVDDTKDADSTNKHGKEEKEAKEDTTTFAGPESKKNNVKNIWTQPKKTSQTITETQVKQLYATGLNAGFNAEIIEKQIQKKFNKGIKELNSNEYYQAYNGYKQMVISKLSD